MLHQDYTTPPSHDRARGRIELAKLSAAAKAGIVSVERAAAAWRATRRDAAIRLARLARTGWLSRVRRGLYYIAPLDSSASTVVDDPWVLASELFAPSYIGGWSAAQHWGLTEQLFRETFVVTAAHVRGRSPVLLGTSFRLVRVARERVESVSSIWRGNVRLGVSTAERTLVDGCTDPSWVGGVRQLVEMVGAYRDSRGGSLDRLAKELATSGSGAAHKRLGYIVEQIWPESSRLTDVAASGRSTGVIRLDPAVSSRGQLNRRWGLWINTTFAGNDR